MSNAAERGQALSSLLSNKQRDEAKAKIFWLLLKVLE